MTAGAALRKAVRDALVAAGGMGVHEVGPVQAAFPYATVECGPESDWGHKSGTGREVRLAVVVRDRGERPDRVDVLVASVEASLGAIGGEVGEWQVVSLRPVRTRLARDGTGWAASIEYRARMLRV